MPNRFNPIHDDDILGTIPGLLAGATVPATTVNWGGQPSIDRGMVRGELGSMIGITPEFVETDQTISSVSVDITNMVALTGEPSTSLHDGQARMVAARRPDLLKPST